MIACLPWWAWLPVLLALLVLACSAGALAVGLTARRAYDRGYRDGWRAFVAADDPSPDRERGS